MSQSITHRSGGAFPNWQKLNASLNVPVGQLLHRSVRAALSTPVYRLTLSGAQPLQPLFYPAVLSAAQTGVANAILSGTYRFREGEKTVAAGQSPWRAKALDPVRDEKWLESLHSFGWLEHFCGSKNEDALAYARALIDRWINECPVGTPVAWRSGVIGQRIIHWLQFGARGFADIDPLWQLKVYKSLSEQLKHLHRLQRFRFGADYSIEALIALSVSAYCFAELRPYAEFAFPRLEATLYYQTLSDGGHVSRDVVVQLGLLKLLLVLKSALDQANEKSPEWLTHNIEQMASFAKLMRHGDGRFALFNGSDESDNAAIEGVLGQSCAQVRAPLQAEKSGYYKLKRGRTCVIVDAGAARTRAGRRTGHAGCLSFEMSAGRHRIIVNCGSAAAKGPEWFRLLRRSSAHSTLVLDDMSSARFAVRENAWSGRADVLALGPPTVTAQWVHEKDSSFLRACHSGYMPMYGYVHERRLRLNSSGEDFQGEDIIERRRGRRSVDSATEPGHGVSSRPLHPTSATVRFHLHPDVRTSMLRDGSSVLLKLPNGDGWVFQSEDGVLGVEESVYFGCQTSMRKTQQIFVRFDIPEGGPKRQVIRWSLSRLGYERDSKENFPSRMDPGGA